MFDAIGRQGHEIRAVGGAVRNTVLGLPVADVDFATTAKPDEARNAAEKAGLKTIPTGIEHGTLTVLAHGLAFEVTTLREDVETDGRHAVVHFGSDWTRDAQRRDFTMNALYADANGVIFDPLGGLPDAMARRVRFIGDARQRIREDHLRTLRFFRINAQYGSGPPDRTGLSAAVRERGGLHGLSAERVRVELFKLLAATGAKRALTAMFEYGVLVQIIGAPPLLRRFERMTALEAALELPADPVRRLAALAMFSAEDAHRLAGRFRLSNGERKQLEIYGAVMPVTIDEREARTLLYKLGPGGYREFSLMAHAHSGASAGSKRWGAVHSLPQRWTTPVFPLKGRDLIKLGGLKGPRIGQVLQQLERRWIEADFKPSREDLLAHARIKLAQDDLRLHRKSD